MRVIAPDRTMLAGVIDGRVDIPEIASDATGSIVIIVGSRDNHFATPFDATGAVSGPAQPLTNCRWRSSERVCMQMCRRAVTFGDGFAFARIDKWPRVRGGVQVGVSFLSRDGKTVRDVSLQAAFPPAARSRRPARASLSRSPKERSITCTASESMLSTAPIARVSGSRTPFAQSRSSRPL